MRVRTIFLLLAAPAFVAAESKPPQLQTSGFEYGQVRLVFDQPMLTWSLPVDSPALRISPRIDCRWYWEDDTTLACAPAGAMFEVPLREATLYRIEVGEGLWSQAGAPFPATTRDIPHAPPRLETAVEWEAGRPDITLYSSQPLAAEAISAVLDLSFEGAPLNYSLEPLEVARSRWSHEEDQDDVAFRLLPGSWPDDVGLLRLALRAGLRTTAGPVPGDADADLLAVTINEPFRLAGWDCGQHNPKDPASACQAGADVVLRFTQPVSAISRHALAARLPEGMSVAKDHDDCDYRCGARNRAPLHALRLDATLAEREVTLDLAGLVSQGGAVLPETTVALAFHPFPAGLRVEPEVRLGLPGSTKPPVVEMRNVEDRPVWRELSIGERIRRSDRALEPSPARNRFLPAATPPVPGALLGRGGVSLGGPRIATQAGRATAVAAFQALVHATDGELLVWATEWRDGAPVTGAGLELLEVDLEGGHKVLATGRTGKDGVARLAVPLGAVPHDRVRLLRAREGRRITVVPVARMTERDVQDSRTGERNGYARYRPRVPAALSFGASERLLYRPGDTVKFHLWHRARDRNRLHVAGGAKTVSLAFAAAYGEARQVWQATRDEWGGVDGEFALPSQLEDDLYCIDFESTLGAGRELTGACFEVRRHTTQAAWASLTPSAALVRGGDRLVLRTEAGYYSGGPAAGSKLRFIGLASALEFGEAYPEFAEYTFAEAENDIEAEANPIPADQDLPRMLDSGGRADVGLVIPDRFIDEADDEGHTIPFARLQFNAYVREPGQEEAASPTAEVLFAQYPRYVGLRADRFWLPLDADPVLDAVVATHDGKTLPGGDVRVRLETVDDDAPQVLGRCRLTAGEAPAPCAVRAPEAGRYALVAEADGAATTRLIRWFGASAHDAQTSHPTASLELIRASDGRTPARVRLRQPHARATALFLLEHDRVVRHWTQSVGPDSEIDVALSPELAPGVSLRVMLRPEADSAEAGLASPTLDAAMRLAVPAAERGAVALSVPAMTLAPGAQLQIVLRNDADAPRQVVVAVVDDAVHQQAGSLHAMIDPSGESFLGRLAEWNEGPWHDLQAWKDVPNYFVQYRNAPAPAAGYGGGETLDTVEVTGSRLRRADIFTTIPAVTLLPTTERPRTGVAAARVRSHFPDGAYWNPGLVLAPGESRTLSVALPDNLTRWRVLAWSADQGDGFGLAQATVSTSLPVELRLGLPVQLVEGDRASGTVSARSATEAAMDVGIEATASGAGISSRGARQERVAAFATLSAPLPLAPVSTGMIDVLARAESAAGVDAVSSSVPVRSRQGETVEVQAGWLEGSLRLPLPDQASAAGGELRLLVSQGTQAWRLAWLDALHDYPHRCWEQTLSRAIGAALALQDPSGRAAWPDARETVSDTLASAEGFVEDGHFHFFPLGRQGMASPDWLLNAHTLRGFGELERLGHAVPAELRDEVRRNLRHFLAEEARRKGPVPLETMAVAAAALADDTPAVDPGALRMLWQAWPSLSWHARSELVRALAASPGFETEFADGVARLREAGTSQGLRRVIREPRDFRWAMGSELRDQCAVTGALWSLDRSETGLPRRREFLRGLQDLYAGGTYNHDTQANLHCLLALRDAAENGASTGDAAEVAASLGGVDARLVVDAAAPLAEWRQPARPGELRLDVEAGADASLSYVAELRASQDLATVPAQGTGMQLQRNYAVLRGGRWTPLAGVSPREGDWIRVTLRLTVPALRHFVAITDAVPGGWSTRDTGLARVAGADLQRVADPGSWWFDSRQTGETEVRLYAESLPPGTHEVHYFAQAQHVGRYFAAPAVAELMYGRASRANTAADWVEIAPAR